MIVRHASASKARSWLHCLTSKAQEVVAHQATVVIRRPLGIGGQEGQRPRLACHGPGGRADVIAVKALLGNLKVVRDHLGQLPIRCCRR